jgi:formate hydrogenlyase transcriptional activator
MRVSKRSIWNRSDGEYMKASAVLQKSASIPAKALADQPAAVGLAAPDSRVHSKTQELAAELFSRFVKISGAQIDSEIALSIRRIVEYLGIDRGFLSQCSSDGTQMICTHCWSVHGGNEIITPSGPLPVPWVQRQLFQGRHVWFSCLGDLPEEAAQDREYFAAVGTKSFLMLPLEIDGKVIGSLSLENIFPDGNNPEDGVRGLKLIADVFAGAVERKRRKLELVERIRFESLLNDISARFVMMDTAEIDQGIEKALQQIAEIFHGDRCGILEVQPEKKFARVSYAWYAEGIQRVPGDINLEPLFPWSYEMLVEQGQSVYFSNLEELPPEAKKDRHSLAAMGVRSALAIPLFIGKSVQYIITFQNMLRENVSIKQHSERLQLLGEIFVHALMRRAAEKRLRISYEEIRQLKDKLQTEAEFLRSEIRACMNREEIVGQSEALRNVLTKVEQVAPADTSVLICGETGTGKELIAQAIHDLSFYRDKVMVKVNCASLPATLVESELFGREKGAYTGAMTRQVGRFELADGSTIFLDEIAELPLALQAKLLRVLQEKTFERLGSPKTIKVNVRVIAATNRNILEEVKKGTFRKDLYYRLAVFPITVPPLRERVEDIPMLVWAFVEEFCKKLGKQIHKIAKHDMEVLQQYAWPGNIRELRNIIEHAVIISSGATLQIQLPKQDSKDLSWAKTLTEVETRHIKDVLRHTGGRIKGEGGAATILGMIPSTLNSRMKKLGIRCRNEKDDISF